MERREFLRKGFQFLALTLCVAETGVVSAAEPINYERLTSTLYPKTEGERKYLKEVAALAKARKLPEKIIHAAWRSAEKKQRNKRVRLFAETLTILCKRNGITLRLKLKV
ncbi:MAG: hypothetical protein ACOX6D_07910 [Thermoguttaceae bacterium]|jgi:hypothetical protein